MPKHDGIVVDPSQRDIASTEERARQVAVSLAQQNISDIGDPLVRPLLPHADLQSGGDSNWTDTDQKWEQLGLTTGQYQTVYQVDSGLRAEDKVIIVYGLTNLSDNPGTTTVRFQTSAGAPIVELIIEGILVDEEVFGLFHDPVVFGASDDGDIDQYSTTADDEVVYHGVVAEKRGETYEDLPNRFLTGHTSRGGGNQGQAVRADGGVELPPRVLGEHKVA